jgi:DNA-binding NarL/FixJ family response regulator
MAIIEGRPGADEAAEPGPPDGDPRDAAAAGEGDEMDGIRGARVLVVEDDLPLARAIRRMLQAAGCGVETAGTAASARDTANARTDGFDAALVDVGLPDETGYSVVYALRHGALPCSAVVMTGEPDGEIIRTSIVAGVSDFLVKPFPSAVLCASLVRAIAHTRAWRFRLASHWDRSVLPGWKGPTSPLPAAPVAHALDLDGTVAKLVERGSLTGREREALELLLRGYRNDEIAAALDISAHTVKYHVRNILRKLSLATRTDLFRLLVD